MSYFLNYIKAVDNPLPELKETFDAELELLKNLANTNSVVLDVGCGVGRPADKLAKFVKKIVAIDNNEQMREEAKLRCGDISNIEISEEDALSMNFSDNTFDLAYATYNLVGSVNENDRQNLINEMRRVVKVGGLVINFTWKNDDVATNFLKRYYPSIGIKILDITNKKTITSEGEFARISKAELENYYNESGLTNIVFKDINPVWTAIIGKK